MPQRLLYGLLLPAGWGPLFPAKSAKLFNLTAAESMTMFLTGVPACSVWSSLLAGALRLPYGVAELRLASIFGTVEMEGWLVYGCYAPCTAHPIIQSCTFTITNQTGRCSSAITAAMD